MIVKLRKEDPGSTAAVALWHKNREVYTHTRDCYKLLSLYMKHSGIKLPLFNINISGSVIN
jgi:hypothetical protein